MPEQTQTQTSSPSSAGTRTLSLLLHHTGGYHHSLQRKKKTLLRRRHNHLTTNRQCERRLPSFLPPGQTLPRRQAPTAACPSVRCIPSHPSGQAFLSFLCFLSVPRPISLVLPFPSLLYNTEKKKPEQARTFIFASE